MLGLTLHLVKPEPQKGVSYCKHTDYVPVDSFASLGGLIHMRRYLALSLTLLQANRLYSISP